MRNSPLPQSNENPQASIGSAPNNDRLHDPVADGTENEKEPRVLLADDDSALHEALRFVLEEEGYSVVEAADGGAALDALRLNATPCIVLLDVLMRSMSGYEILLRVAADPVLRTRHAY